MNEPDRRTLIRYGSTAVALLAVAGCLEELESEPERGPDEGIQDEQNGAADEDDVELLDEEPDYGDWFEDTENYDGTVDRRESDEERIHVGFGENGFLFEPAAVAVSTGTTVTWEWTGEGGSHNVVEEDEVFASELAEEEGHTFEHTFEEADVFRYLCEPHEDQGMRGAVMVDSA